MRWEFSVLIGAAGALALLGIGYLAACAGAQRWLTFREWWGS
jgi:hypothetical protein